MKALFFLRHYNDIDHVTPVIYKWIQSGHQCDVVLIGSAKFRRDFRVQYLSQLKGVRVAHMQELFSWLDYLKWRLQMLLLTRNVRRINIIGNLVAALAERYDENANPFGVVRRISCWNVVSLRVVKGLSLLIG